MDVRQGALAGAVLLSVTAPLTGFDALGSAGQLDSGVRGRVLYGPTCPVQRVGQTCTRPYQATISIRSKPTNRLVARVRSSISGHFSIRLAPGRYLLTLQNGHPFPRSSPQTITVHSHRYTSVIINYDSGIR
ncbi:MAG: hypothetical protein ACRDK2_02135 [Solirubrobacteraceae bacterium]